MWNTWGACSLNIRRGLGNGDLGGEYLEGFLEEIMTTKS